MDRRKIEMVAINEWVWVFDNTLLLCRNVENRIMVDTERTGNIYMGDYQDIPMALFGEMAELNYKERITKPIAGNEDDEFIRTHLGE